MKYFSGNSILKVFATMLLASILFCVTTSPTAAADSTASDASATATEVETYKSEELPFDPKTADKNLTSISDSKKGIDLEKGNPVSAAYWIINILLTFLGTAFLVLLIYAGVIWVIARGNQEEIAKAKKLIERGVIGLVIILASWGLAALTFEVISLSSSGELDKLSAPAAVE